MMKYKNTLCLLKKNKELNYSQVPKDLLSKLKDEGLIEIKILSAKRKKVLINNLFLEKYRDIEDIIKAKTRHELVALNQDSKVKRISPQDGLYVNGKCQIEHLILPLFAKSAMFLKEIPILEKDTLIVIVENFENLIYFENQLKLFSTSNILFIYRNKKMLEAICTLENKIIYFGDFDLAGIAIYMEQILPRNPKISFFIPHNIEKLIENYGSRELFDKQFNKYKNLKSTNIRLQNLIDIIKKHQKALEQEYFL